MEMVKYIVHSDIDENNIRWEFDNKQEAIDYAKENKEDETWVDAVEVEVNDFGEVIEEYGTETIWSYLDECMTEETHAKEPKPAGDKVLSYNTGLKLAKVYNKPVIYGYSNAKLNGKFFALEDPIVCDDMPECEKEFRNQYKNCGTVYVAYPDKDFIEGYKPVDDFNTYDFMETEKKPIDEDILVIDPFSMDCWDVKFEPRCDYSICDVAEDEACGEDTCEICPKCGKPVCDGKCECPNEDGLCCEVKPDGKYECKHCEEDPEEKPADVIATEAPKDEVVDDVNVITKEDTTIEEEPVKTEVVVKAEVPEEVADKLDSNEATVSIPDVDVEAEGEVVDVQKEEKEDKVEESLNENIKKCFIITDDCGRQIKICAKNEQEAKNIWEKDYSRMDTETSNIKTKCHIKDIETESLVEEDVKSDIVEPLVKDEEEAIKGYEDAKKDLEKEENVSVENKDKINQTFDHIAAEEKEHIEEIKDVTKEVVNEDIEKDLNEFADTLESVNKSEENKDVEKHNCSENDSENLTLNEDSVEAELNKFAAGLDEAVEDEAEVEDEPKEAIDVIKDIVDIHGEDNTVVIAEKGKLDDEEAPKIEVEVTEPEFDALEKEFHEDEEEDISDEELAEKLYAAKEAKKLAESEEKDIVVPGVKNEQELQGTDNAVVDCPVNPVIAHSEDEKPLDCKMEKEPLEKPLIEDNEAKYDVEATMDEVDGAADNYNELNIDFPDYEDAGSYHLVDVGFNYDSIKPEDNGVENDLDINYALLGEGDIYGYENGEETADRISFRYFPNKHIVEITHIGREFSAVDKAQAEEILLDNLEINLTAGFNDDAE